MPGDITARFSTDLTISDFPLQYPITIQFTDMSLGNPDEWFWDFGTEDAFSTSQNPLVTFNEEPENGITLYAWKEREGNSFNIDDVVGGGRKLMPIIWPQPVPPWVWWCNDCGTNPEVWPYLQGTGWTDLGSSALLVGKVAWWNALVPNGYYSLEFYYIQIRLDLTSRPNAFLTYMYGVNDTFSWTVNDSGCAPSNQQNILFADDQNEISKKISAAKFSVEGDAAIMAVLPNGGNRVYTYMDYTNYIRYMIPSADYPLGDTKTVCDPGSGDGDKIGYQVRPSFTRIESITSDHYDIVVKDLTKGVDFVGVPRSGASPLSVQFTDLSIIDVASWSWNFGDGPVLGTTQDPLHVYTVGLTN